MDRSLPYEELSPWVEVPEDLRPPLDHDLQADVVVIGGGYTGLSTALALRAQGADVVVLEREFAGSGASGRNAGHLTPTIGKDIPTLLRMFGRERASALVRFADAAVEHTEETIRKHGIDCDYRPTGNVLGGVHPKHEQPLARASEAAAGLGAKVRYLDADEMRERGIPASFCCGVLEEMGGHLHPGRYVMGLRGAALAAGVRLFENSALTSLIPEANSRVEARTYGGSVRANFAVLATNAYTASTGWKPRTAAPLRVSLFETAPLDASQLDELDWRGGEGIYTAHEILESYRLTAHKTIVGGSRVVRYAWGNALAPGYRPDDFALIESCFRERFPCLGEQRIETFWGGWIGLTFDFLPAFGADSKHPNVLHGIGYAGHGVAQAALVGEMLAEKVQGREHEWESALRRRRIDWPRAPFLWAGGKLLIGILEALDRRTDRQIRARRRSSG